MEQDKPLTRDALVSMQVIDARGRLVGKVKDVAFAVGRMGIALTVENERGEVQNVSWEDVQAASDFIILKPSSSPVASASRVQPQQQQPTQQASTHDLSTWQELIRLRNISAGTATTIKYV